MAAVVSSPPLSSPLFSAIAESSTRVPVAERVAAAIASLPRHLLQGNAAASLRSLATTLVLGTLAYVLAATLPWFALPLCWVLLGALYAGLSAIVHDCAQGTFSASLALNRVVGTVAALPLFVPFASPVWNAQPSALVGRLAQGRAWLLAAAVEIFAARGPRRSAWWLGVALQWACAYGLFRAWGFAALVKYWLAPWAVYLVWRSVFLQSAYLSATLPVPFTSTQLRLQFNVQKYPRWLRLLTNDVASVISATRLLSSYVQDVAHVLPSLPIPITIPIPSAHAAQLLAYLNPAVATDAALAAEREKIRLAKLEAECETLRTQLDFGTPIDKLVPMSKSNFSKEGRARKWVLCDGIVFDVSTFYTSHPGGEAILNPFYGLDITKAFNGGVYNHSNGARNLSRHFMIARIEEDGTTLSPESTVEEAPSESL